ncbi:MAG: prepilin-type N-terminal cleavage/methylation domain-containing protein [Candidatus Magnetoovum sp. WYHC-5]|nr:prepilin-type N-terminal cleavage/methylation domain-containing protein [Candidatus Magnetoovum sp. WYHC-5]
MESAFNSRKVKNGFTLIELLIVLGIMAIVAIIAIPSFLGQREKSQIAAVKSSAKAAVGEIEALLDSYMGGAPFLLLDETGAEICVQIQGGNIYTTCQTMYNVSTNINEYNDMADVIDYLIKHYEGQRYKSPYNTSSYLFVKTPAVGSIVLSLAGSKTVSITAYARDLSQPVFEASITAR